MYAIIVPVYNEAPILERSLTRLSASAPVAGAGERLIVLIDDGSTDGSGAILEGFADKSGFALVKRERNGGKGAAVRAGIATASERGAHIVVVHDADLEYDPADHARLLAPILDGRADAVIGSRFIGQAHRVLYFWHAVANRFITLLSNVMTNLNLTDIECCLKAMRTEIAVAMALGENGFGIEPEIIARLSRTRIREQETWRSVRIYEVAVSYAGRTYAEGKKIGWRDGLRALWCIVRYNTVPGRPTQVSVGARQHPPAQERTGAGKFAGSDPESDPHHARAGW